MSVDDLVAAMDALDRATPGYREARGYAHGNLPEKWGSPNLRRAIEARDDFRFRLSAVPMEVMADRVQVASVASERGEAVTARIEAIREANRMQFIEPHMIRELFTLGDAYLFVWPVERDDESQPFELREAGVEITYLSPLGTRAIYHAGDPLTPLYVIRRWQTETEIGPRWNAELWYDEIVEAWIADPGTNGTDPVVWHPYAEDESGFPVPAVIGENWPVEHGLDGIPIKHCRTGLPYGRPEHIEAYGPQDAITIATITQSYIVQEQGWRKRIRIMNDKLMLDVGRDVVSWGESADAPDATDAGMQRVERTGLSSDPGTEDKYFGTQSVQVVEPPDPGRLIEPIEQWVRLMATVTKTPLYEFDQRTGQQMSGVARELADRPLKAKEKDRKRYLQGALREVYTLALSILSTEPGVIVVNWALPDVTTDPQWWTTAQIREVMGVPIEQILAEANYSPDLIKTWLDNQVEATTLDKGIARLQSLAEALQAMGTAVAMGAVQEDTAQALIASILGDSVPTDQREITA